MTLSEKVKALRKATGLTQQEFAEKVGVTRNNLAGYETGRREPSAAVMELIITKLDVSETWLQTGEGNPFNPTPKTHIDELVKQYGLDDVDREIIMEFINLEPNERRIIKNYIQRVAQHIKEQSEQHQPPEPLTAEQEARAEAEQFYQERLMEKKQASQAFSVKGSDVG